MCGFRKYLYSCVCYKEGCWELREVLNVYSFKRNIMINIIIIVKFRFYNNGFINILDFYVMV